MKVTLKQDHTHADVTYKAGETIPDVPRTDAEWMQANGVIDEPGLRASVAAKSADNVTPIKP